MRYNEAMGHPEAEAITQLLAQVRDGDAAAGEVVLPLLYRQLHASAMAAMRGEARAVTMQPTALVNECWLRLQRSPGAPYADRGQFLRLAGRVMRNVLVDVARQRQRRPNAAGDVLALDIGGGDTAEVVDFLDLEAAVARLAEHDEQLVQLVELRYFAGMTLEETAQVLEVSTTQVHRMWQLARAFLLRELRDGRV